MALSALIAAYAQAEGAGDGLRATLPLAGRTLVEHQARLARRAGATHIVILIERLPATLTAAIDRLRRDGLDVDIARSAADAADRFHPDERLLFFGDGFVGDMALIETMAEAEPAALLTVPDGPETTAFERIDALSRWAGLATIDGAALRKTAAMLGDWDLQSTLLRRIVQAGCKRIEAPRDKGAPRIAGGPAALEGIAGKLVAASRGRAQSWPARYLFPVIETPLLQPLVRSAVEPLWLSAFGIGLILVGAVALVMGWLCIGLATLLIAGPVESIAQRLAQIRLASPRHDPVMKGARAGASGIALVALCGSLAMGGNWGCWPLGGAILAFSCAMEREETIFRRLAPGPVVSSPWFARIDGLIWTYLPFAITGYWRTGLAALAIYAGASFFMMQRKALEVIATRA